MRIAAAAGSGFLLAVLWFDLMFDVQVRGHRGGTVPGPVRESIAAYYAACHDRGASDEPAGSGCDARGDRWARG